MQRIIYTNARGQSVELKSSAPFLLQSIDGLGDVDADIQTQKAPFQDGSTYIDSVLQERVISMQIAILASDTATLLQQRQYLAAVFNPKLGLGTLRYENGETIREIEVVPDGVPVFPSGTDNRGPTFQKAIVNLLCPSPFWLDITSENIKLEDFVAHFRFPFRFPVRFASRGDSRVVVNDGDVPVPIKVTFRGEAVNPKITNLTTGEFIKVNRSIPSGYSLVINTEFGRKEVKIIAPDGVEENAFHYIDLESTFFLLQVGENKLSFITDGGRPEVYVEYRSRYVGV